MWSELRQLEGRLYYTESLGQRMGDPASIPEAYEEPNTLSYFTSSPLPLQK